MKDYIIEEYLRIDIFRSIVYEWYLDKMRIFSWRTTENPYAILISEMMLKKTRAEQVAPVYEKFLNRYSTVYSLAKAEIKEVEEILRTLGLKSRYKVFIDAANFIINNYDGVIPKNKDQLLLIPGVGDYVAGMVMNCAFGKREYVVDTNIGRVFNRILDLNLTGEIRRNKEIIKYSSVYFDIENSREHSYAILDFASTICKSINPSCNICPVNKYKLCTFNNC